MTTKSISIKKKRHLDKLVNQDNLGYLSKLVNHFNPIKKQNKNKEITKLNTVGMDEQ
jgi:hypothetical protein